MEAISDLKGVEGKINYKFDDTLNNSRKKDNENKFNVSGSRDEFSNKSILKKLIPSLAITSISTMVLMTIYEVVKQVLHPDITIWQSHMITIFFTTIVAPLTAYFAFRKLEISRK